MEVLHFRVAECVKHGIIPGRTVRDLFIQVDRDKYPDAFKLPGVYALGLSGSPYKSEYMLLHLLVDELPRHDMIALHAVNDNIVDTSKTTFPYKGNIVYTITDYEYIKPDDELEVLTRRVGKTLPMVVDKEIEIFRNLNRSGMQRMLMSTYVNGKMVLVITDGDERDDVMFLALEENDRIQAKFYANIALNNIKAGTSVIRPLSEAEKIELINTIKEINNEERCR